MIIDEIKESMKAIKNKISKLMNDVKYTVSVVGDCYKATRDFMLYSEPLPTQEDFEKVERISNRVEADLYSSTVPTVKELQEVIKEPKFDNIALDNFQAQRDRNINATQEVIADDFFNHPSLSGTIDEASIYNSISQLKTIRQHLENQCPPIDPGSMYSSGDTQKTTFSSQDKVVDEDVPPRSFNEELSEIKNIISNLREKSLAWNDKLLNLNNQIENFKNKDIISYCNSIKDELDYDEEILSNPPVKDIIDRVQANIIAMRPVKTVGKVVAVKSAKTKKPRVKAGKKTSKAKKI